MFSRAAQFGTRAGLLEHELAPVTINETLTFVSMVRRYGQRVRAVTFNAGTHVRAKVVSAVDAVTGNMAEEGGPTLS